MAQRITTQIASIIDASVAKFEDGMAASGRNAWNRVRPILNDLETDEDGKLTGNPQQATEQVNAVMEDAFSTAAHASRVAALKQPLPEIQRLTLRDFSRKFGLVDDSAIEQSRQMIGVAERQFDENYNQQRVEDTIIAPVLATTALHIQRNATKASLIKNVEDRITEGQVSFAASGANAIYNQYSRAISEIYANNFELVWARYDGPTTGTTLTPEAPRDFCRARVNKVFHVSEISSWSNEEWEGKLPNTNGTTIFVNLGGYNCRHRLVYIKASQVPDSAKRRVGVE